MRRGKEFARYKKAFKKRQKKLIKYIKKDYCEFNGEAAFLEINKMLLENYLEYYTNRDNVYQSDDSLLPTIEQLKECLDLINKLIIDDYDTSATEFADEHRVAKKELDGSIKFQWDSETSHQSWLTKVKLAESQRSLDYKKAFKLIGTYCRNWWD